MGIGAGVGRSGTITSGTGVAAETSAAAEARAAAVGDSATVVVSVAVGSGVRRSGVDVGIAATGVVGSGFGDGLAVIAPTLTPASAAAPKVKKRAALFRMDRMLTLVF